MATRLDISSAASFDFDDADTIEMELTPAQMLALTQAAAISQPVAIQSPPRPSLPARLAPVVIVPRISHQEVAHRAVVKHRVGARLAIALGAVGAAVVLSGVAYVVGKRSAPVQIVTLAPPPPAPVEPPTPVAEVPVAQVEPVRFTNPFDASEVFEFPPGTNRAEARDAVAELLLERARQRQNPNSIEQATTNGLVQSH